MHVFIIPILRFASLFKQQTSFEQAKKRKSLILGEKLVQQPSGMSLAKRQSDLHRGKTYEAFFLSWFKFQGDSIHHSRANWALKENACLHCRLSNKHDYIFRTNDDLKIPLHQLNMKHCNMLLQQHQPIHFAMKWGNSQGKKKLVSAIRHVEK